MEIISSDVITNIPSKKTVSQFRNNQNSVRWWDAECDKAKRLRKTSFKKWQFTNKSSDFIEYKKNEAIAKKHLKKKKVL